MDRTKLHQKNLGWIAVVSITLVGFGAELALLGHAPDSALAAGGRLALFAIVFVAWLWLTLGIGCVWTATRMATSIRTGPPLRAYAVLAGVTLITAAVSLPYVVSWALYLQTNRFASWEVIAFTLENLQGLASYLLVADPGALLRLSLIAAMLLLVFPLLLYQLAIRWSPSITVGSLFDNRVWIWASVTMLLAFCLLVRDPSPRRRFARLGQVKSALNPALTMITSFADAVAREPIHANLSVSELLPRDTAWSLPEEGTKKPSIIFVAIESLRHDVVHQCHQGREITPHINKLARAGVHWKKAYAQSTHSDYADVCIVSSLYPLRTRTHHYYSRSDPWPKALIYDLLKPLGYATAIISSQNEAWGRMDAFLASPGLDFFYHPETSANKHLLTCSKRDAGFHLELETGALLAGKFPDSHTTDVAIEWIRQQSRGENPFFLSMNLQSSHFPYQLPAAVLRPFQPCAIDADVNFLVYPKEKTPQVRNAYYNALHEADRQVGRLVNELRRLELLDDVILVVVGENGEAFNENGVCGHGREPMEPAIHVATVFHAPRFVAPHVEEYPLEHVDIVPTVFGLLDWPAHPNFQGIDALAASRPALAERLLFFHVLSPLARADAVQLAGRWKYVIDRATNRAALFDLSTDATESQDLSATQPELVQRLHDILHCWRSRQLAYYHFPAYYSDFFPPRPPPSHSNGHLDEVLSASESMSGETNVSERESS